MREELYDMAYVDLHIHSFYSDGTMSPQEILQEAIKNKVDVIAITDHNVIEGSRKLLELCKNTSVHCISGVELDAIQNDVNYHILGYGVNLQDKLFVERVVNNSQLLEEVNITLIKKMQIDYNEVILEEYISFDYERELGGWKALHYFVYKGLVHNLIDGFYFYKKYDHSYTCVDFPNVKTLCSWIHEAGGIAVLAHPGKVIKTTDIDGFKKSILQLIECGIDGIECYYPTHTKEVTSLCLSICDQNRLIITSGSDCHGTFQETYIGQLCTNIEEVNLGRL
jgi:predicted metal-dependent phosphoesterase TrpH